MFYSNPGRKYFLLLTAVLIIFSFTGWRVTSSEQPSIGSKTGIESEGEKTTDEVFKNIKVLNGQPASQLGPAMHFFEAALGFNCANCHVKGDAGMDFEKDDKPEKRKTRDMITMMNVINKENFKGEQLVTCFTCHKGSPDPIAIPVVFNASLLKNEGNEEETIKVPNRLGTAEEIISKYQEAIGGKDTYEKITSLKLEGIIDAGNGKESSTTIYEKAPYLYYSETQSPQGNMQRGYNGEAGWIKTPRFERKIEGDDLQDIKLSSDFYAPLNFGKNYSGLKLADVQIIDKDTVYAVEGNYSKYRRFEFFFDVKSGLLVRQIQFNRTLFGELQIQTDYKNYQSVNGVLFPFELDVADYEHIQQFKFSNITPNITIDDKIFDMAGK
ncbi:MAG: c-type cytochrome [Ignavibacteriaceae bacterium]|jgi:hypothetical protein